MNKKMTIWLMAGLFAAVGGYSALAHSGAMGIVKERMDGMSAMGDAVKTLSDMFRSGDHDPNIIKENAAIFLEHSGENLIKLFPEGSGGAPSEAKPGVWENWPEFARLAEELGTLATALAANADQAQSNSGASGASGMMGTTSTDMMGTAATGMMGGVADMATPEMLAQMPADRVFNMIVRSCASCHTKYRVEK